MKTPFFPGEFIAKNREKGHSIDFESSFSGLAAITIAKLSESLVAHTSQPAASARDCVLHNPQRSRGTVYITTRRVSEGLVHHNPQRSRGTVYITTRSVSKGLCTSQPAASARDRVHHNPQRQQGTVYIATRSVSEGHPSQASSKETL